jgi:hypothetical protein
MARESAESKAAKVWRTGAKYPPIPSDLPSSIRKHYKALMTSREVHHWTRNAQDLLRRYVLTFASAEKAQRRLDNEDDPRMISAHARSLATLNSSLITMSRQLRLTPLSQISSDARDQLHEPPAAMHDRLIGGRADQQRNVRR